MRAILVTPRYPPYASGAGEYFYNYVKHLNKKIDLIVLTTCHKDKKLAYQEDNAKIFRIIPDFVSSHWILRYLLLPICTFLSLIYLSIRFRPKFIHTHSSTAMTAGVSFFSMLFRTPVIQEVLDVAVPGWLMKVGNIKYYFATGKAVEDRLNSFKINHKKIVMLYPPKIDPLDFRFKKRKNSLVFVAELNKEVKGVDVLMNAFKVAVSKNSDILLTIVGKGPAWNYCRDFISENNLNSKINMVGFLPFNDMLKKIAESEILILPSKKNEATPRVILEAFYFKTAVIASDIPGNNFLVKDGFNGLLFESGNYHELSKKIIELIEDKGTGEKLIENAEIYLEKLPSWKGLSETVLGYYHKI